MSLILSAAMLVASTLHPALTHGPGQSEVSPDAAGRTAASEPQSPSEALRTRQGTLWQAHGHGSRYLAIPEGPGVRVRIIGPAGAVNVTSTDAGPALFRQREGRIGDLAIGLWRVVCGAKREPLGFCDATIVYGSVPRVPSTDTAP
jgi:hypothetical protein